MTAKSALSSRYFMVDPKLPSSPMELGAIDLGENENGFHEFQTKKRRKEAKILADKVMKKGKSKGLSQKEIEEESNAVYREQQAMQSV